MTKINTNTVNDTNYSHTPNSQSLGSLDNFLQLFLTQLRYQSPFDPVKDHEFIAQLAQFSNLEEAQETNALLTGLNRQFHDFAGLHLLGQEVYVKNDHEIFSGVVEGVSFIEGKAKLIVGGKRVNLGQILHIGSMSEEEEESG